MQWHAQASKCYKQFMEPMKEVTSQEVTMAEICGGKNFWKCEKGFQLCMHYITFYLLHVALLVSTF